MTHLRIVPLGGLGEVGMNCLALETDRGIVVVDCGVSFPDDAFGADIAHPDFSYLWERRDEILGVVLTHGHEDHVGALPYLLRRIPVPVWGTPYTLEVARCRIEENDEVPAVAMHTLVPRELVEIGPFLIEPIRVTHSIPDAVALCIDAPGGRVLHTGDFKLERAPLDGEPTDLDRLREIGDEGVDVLLSDSTNAEVDGETLGEDVVAEALFEAVRKARGRVFVALFASNVFRVQTLFDVAARTNRKIVLSGRSVQNHLRFATRAGRFRIPADRVVDGLSAMSMAPERVLAIVSGTQAEAPSALSRIARGAHSDLAVERGDTVILSSRVIPGREHEVQQMVCDLERRGAEVLLAHGGDRNLHASGHAARGEQRAMIQTVRPRGFLPVHGNYRHLLRHARLARDCGVHTGLVVENGTPARWADGTLSAEAPVPHGKVFVDGMREIDAGVIEDRARVARAGVVSVAVMVDARGRVQGDALVESSGVVDEGSRADAHRKIRNLAEASVAEAYLRGRFGGAQEAERRISRGVRRLYRAGDREPLVFVHVLPAI